ncbi:hypothetical protein [Pseudomonas versuta]|uniref:Uncharacterized protein n=1 Tax=Pseudomonas versuta TaxID=1788301 RepID=A0ABX3E8V7_9PSED|nr:hypothetical protein [Pseudomonas versuta]ALE88188.1 hypothetical protein AOC04_08230 [Pseudomonas versuta]OKA22110.1 hypothetical protein BOH73_06605 [Pseudomonas versuta]
MTKASDPYWYINDMEVHTDTTPHIYANGLQQVKITLGVKALDGRGTEVGLTQNEKNNLRLVMYRNANQVLPFDEFDSLGWSASYQYKGYEYFPTTNLKASIGPKAGFEYFEFYVACESLGAAGQTIGLAFMVKGDNGRRFCSNGSSWYEDGTPDRGTSHDKPDANITVHRPPRYSQDNFILSEFFDLPATQLHAGIFNRRCTLTLQTGVSQTVALKSMSLMPKGMIMWESNLPDDQLCSFVGYVEPGKTQIQWNPALPQSVIPLPTLPAAIRDKGSLVLCGRVDLKQAQGGFRGPCAMSLVDVYGNQHDLSLRFDPKDRERLELTLA